MKRRKSTKNANCESVFKCYNSVAELSATLKNTEPYKDWEWHSMFRNAGEYQKRWAGETLDDSIEKLDKGDAAAAAKIKAQGDILAEQNCGRMPKIETSVIGCVPNVPNYLRGVPTNMMRVNIEPRQKPIIDMYINSAIYAGIDTDKVAKAAAMIANLIAGTEAADIRVNLYAINAVSKNGGKYGMCVKIKDADSPLNLLNIGYCICNRAFCRCTFTRWLECNVEHYVENYGTPMYNESIKESFNVDGLFFDIKSMVENNTTFEELEMKTNGYLKSREN